MRSPNEEGWGTRNWVQLWIDLPIRQVIYYGLSRHYSPIQTFLSQLLTEGIQVWITLLLHEPRCSREPYTEGVRSYSNTISSQEPWCTYCSKKELFKMNTRGGTEREGTREWRSLREGAYFRMKAEQKWLVFEFRQEHYCVGWFMTLFPSVLVASQSAH